MRGVFCMNKNGRVKRKRKRNLIILRIAVGFLVSFAYFWTVNALTQTTYSDCFFHKATISITLAIANCTVIMIMAIVMGRNVPIWLSRHKTYTSLIMLVIIICLLLPISFRRQGIVANETSIQKRNWLGEITQHFAYSDISSIEVSVKYGIQYDIVFNSGKSLRLCSEELRGVKQFKSDKELMRFDQTISQYASKTVSDDPAWIRSSNTRRFFEDEFVFDYFDAFFRQYYQIEEAVKTN